MTQTDPHEGHKLTHEGAADYRCSCGERFFMTGGGLRTDEEIRRRMAEQNRPN
jgi:hypothetical protein